MRTVLTALFAICVVCSSVYGSGPQDPADPNQNCRNTADGLGIQLPLQETMIPKQLSYVDQLSGTQANWKTEAPFSNEVLDRSGIASLRGVSVIPVIPGGSALAALGTPFSKIYASNRTKYSQMEKTFTTDYFGAIDAVEDKLASMVGSNRAALEKKVSGQFAEALTVFDSSHPNTPPSAILVGGSICVGSDGKTSFSHLQIISASDCQDGKKTEVFSVYSLDFNPAASHLGLTLKSAGVQISQPNAAPQVQIGGSLSAINLK